MSLYYDDGFTNFGEWAEQMAPTPQQIREKNPRYQRWARKRRKDVASVAEFWEDDEDWEAHDISVYGSVEQRRLP